MSVIADQRGQHSQYEQEDDFRQAQLHQAHAA